VAEFIDAACPYLSGSGGGSDAQIVLMLVQSYAEFGLGDPARELVRLRAEFETPEMAGVAAPLLEQLARVPSGTITWTERAETHARNLAILRETRPELSSLATRDHADPAVHGLHRSLDGEWHLSRHPGPAPGPTPGLRTWITRFARPAERDRYEVPRPGGTPQVILVLGCGLDRLLEQVVRTSTSDRGQPAAPIYVIEENPARFVAWLHVGVHEDVLRSDRVLLFVGRAARADCERALLDRPGLPLPDRVLSSEPAPEMQGDVPAIIETVRTTRLEATRRVIDDIRARDAARPADEWARRMEPGATILGVTSLSTTMARHAMRDLAEGFRRAGYAFEIAIEPSPIERHAPLLSAEAVLRLDPALVVLINHLRPTDPAMFGETPVLTWVQDPVDTILSREGAMRAGSRDFLAGFYREQCVEQHGYPGERYLPIGFFPVSGTTFHDAPLDPEDHARFDCDVAYVGHCHGTPESFLARMLSDLPADVHPVVETIRDRVSAITRAGGHLDHVQARRIVEESRLACGLDLPERAAAHLAAFVAHRLFDIAFRLESLEWTAAWADATGGRFHLYRGAAVTIQTTPTGLTHQRTFEALLSGSLVVGRYAPADFDGLDPQAFRVAHGDGRDFDRILYREGFRSLDRVVYRSREELARLLDRFTTDPGARNTIARAQAALVREAFTYATVVPGIIDFVQRGLAAASAAATTVTAADGPPAAPSG